MRSTIVVPCVLLALSLFILPTRSFSCYNFKISGGNGVCDCRVGDYANGVVAGGGLANTIEDCMSLCGRVNGNSFCLPAPANAAPTASNVNISGTVANGQTLTGSYTYDDADTPKDEEGTSTFKWYRATDDKGTGKAAIDGAVSKDYTVTAGDVGKFLCFEVTPVAKTGTSPGTAVMSACVEYPYAKGTCYEMDAAEAIFYFCHDGLLTSSPVLWSTSTMDQATFLSKCGNVPICVNNAAPTATVSISGSDCLTGTLTGSYVYKDTDTPTDAEDTANTKLQWYNATKSDCSDKSTITEATSATYTPKDTDRGRYICFGVTPAAKTGSLIGTEKIAVTKAAVATPAYSSDPAVSAAIDFGTIAKPANATKTLTVTNAGTGTLSVTGITLSDKTHFSVSPNTADIACSANKAFTITCNGTEKGTFTATMAVAHNAAVITGPIGPGRRDDSTANYTLSCTVTTAPLYSSSPALNATLSMTSCTPADATATLSVTNTGSDVLNITAVTLGGTNAAKFSVSPMPGATAVRGNDPSPGLTVAVGKSQVFTITGKGSAAGSFTGTLELAHNAAGSPAAYKLSSVISDCYVPVYYEPSYYAPPVNQAPVADILYVSTGMNKAIPVALTGIDPGSDFFTLLMKPLTYSVVTQPQHGALTGTAPNLIYTPEQGFTGTDSFTYRIYDGTAYSAPAAVSVIVHQNSHANIGDKYEIDIFCAEYEGAKYGFRLNLTPVAADPSAYYWKGDVLTFGKAYSDSSGKGCISVEKGFQLNVPTAVYRGTVYQFTLNFTPVTADPFGFYWKMDLDTLKKQ